MDEKEIYYRLPALKYGFGDLAPFMSEKQLTVHYNKHHQAYVDNANLLLQKIDDLKENTSEENVKALARELSFNIGGNLLHTLFWETLTPKSLEPKEKLKKMLEDNFGSLGKFKAEFIKLATTCEGSGWASLVFCPVTGRLLLMQIEKHNVNVIPQYRILLLLDVWEHAYYLDYANDRSKYAANFWDHVNWPQVESRLAEEAR